MIKKIFVLTVICVLMLSGCSDSTELGNRAIIQAAAVDYDGKYKLSALLFSSGGSGGDTIDASQENVICVNSEGETFAEAIDNLSLIDGKKIYMSETKLLVLGSGFEGNSAVDVLNTLYFDMRCSLSMSVCCAENAAEITDLRFTEGITSAEKLLSVIENANQAGASPKTTLLDLLCDSIGGKNSLVPMLSVTENGRGMTASDDNKTAVLCGSRRFEEGKLAGFYDCSETEALMIVTGKTNKITLNYLCGNSEKTCEAYCIKVKRSGDNRWTVSAKFRTRSGGRLSDSERSAALSALGEIVERVL